MDMIFSPGRGERRRGAGRGGPIGVKAWFPGRGAEFPGSGEVSP